MAETTKYDYFMDELTSLEKQVYTIVNKEEEIIEEKKALLKELQSLKDENEILRIKLEEAERKIESSDTDLFNEKLTFNTETKEAIKNKIDDLINKIDNHLRS